MGVDIDTSKKFLDMMNRTRSAIPHLIDQANESGDYSQVDQAQKTLDRLMQIGQHHLDEFQKAQGHGSGGGGSPVEEVNGGSALPPQPQAAPPPQESAVPPMPQEQPPPQPQGASPESTAHEAARGAAKGIVEAQQEKKSGSLGYAPGELSFKSDLSPWDQPAAPQARALPEMSPEDQDTAGYLALPPLERKAEMQRRLDRTFSPEMEARTRGAKVDSLLKDYDDLIDETGAMADRYHKGLSDKANSSMDELVAMGDQPQELAPGEKLRQTENAELLKNAKIPDEPWGESAVPDINAGSGQPDEDTLAGASVALKQQYGNNGLKLAQDFERQADLDEREREYVRRVMKELGPRPQLATIPKILAAFAVGVGGALGSWISGKYNGQSLMDMGADQRLWDQERAAIGREVYQAHKLWGRTALSTQGSLERTKVQQGGQDARLGVKEAGMDRRTEMTEKGKDTRAGAALQLRDRVAASRDATALAIAKMRQGDPATKARLQPLLEQKKSLQKRFDDLADIARSSMMEPVEFYKTPEIQSILKAIDQIDARMFEMAPKEPPGNAPPPK